MVRGSFLMERVWFLYILGNQQGPYNKEEVLDLLKKQEVSLDTLTWKNGMDEWLPLKETKSLDSGLVSAGLSRRPTSLSNRRNVIVAMISVLTFISGAILYNFYFKEAPANYNVKMSKEDIHPVKNAVKEPEKPVIQLTDKLPAKKKDNLQKNKIKILTELEQQYSNLVKLTKRIEESLETVIFSKNLPVAIRRFNSEYKEKIEGALNDFSRKNYDENIELNEILEEYSEDFTDLSEIARNTSSKTSDLVVRLMKVKLAISLSVKQRLTNEIFDNYGPFKETCLTKISFYRQELKKAIDQNKSISVAD